MLAIDELMAAFLLDFAQQDARWLHILLAVLAAGVAMLAGAWSVDARLFGRKRFESTAGTGADRPH